jgi:hypothetical protein
MRIRTLIVLACCLALPVLAQNKQPPGLEPVPEPPPPPPGSEPDSATEPQVTITKRGGDQVEEYRMNGKLYMIKVTPPNGKTYYLIDRDGTGNMARSDVGGRPTSPPQWVIKRF